MKRYEYEKALYESNLDSASKAILAYYGFRKNWEKDGKVWVSAETIHEGTGLSVRTIENRIPKIREAGWLVDTLNRKPNGKGRPSVVYDLAIGKDFTANGEVLNRKIEGTLPQTVQDFTAPVAEEQVIEQVSNKKEEQETSAVASAPADSLNPEVKEEPYIYEGSLNPTDFLEVTWEEEKYLLNRQGVTKVEDAPNFKTPHTAPVYGSEEWEERAARSRALLKEEAEKEAARKAELAAMGDW